MMEQLEIIWIGALEWAMALYDLECSYFCQDNKRFPGGEKPLMKNILEY